jgi:glycosyltransferase involved in cell wall biosynthesis
VAYVLKKPEGASPGVIIFTHKEFGFFSEERPALADAIELLKAKYVLGMHWGHYAKDVVPPPDIAFHLAGPGTLHLRPGMSSDVFPLASRNFRPPEFRNEHANKFWDIFTVARPMRLKKLDEFFKVLKRVMAERPQTRTLLICPEIPDAKESSHYIEMVRDMREWFTEAEQENITLLLLSKELYPFPLSPRTMVHFYNASRFFALFSEQEGGPRAIPEALLCGLPVFVRKNLRGGGRDQLNEANSSQFEDLDDAVRLFLDALEGRKIFDVDSEELARELRSDYTTPRLVEALQGVFEKLGRPFEGEIEKEGLDRRLSAHCALLPANIRSAHTDDIRSPLAFVEFVNMLTNGRLPRPKKSVAKSLRHTARSIKQRIVG